MIQALYCQNGGHVYEREASRGRPPISCVDHGGTGIVVRKYRAGSRNGEAALRELGGPVKARLATKDQRNAAAAQRAVAAAVAAAPRTVPVRKVAGSDEGSSIQDDDVFDFSEELFDTFPLDGIEVKPGYRPETTAEEQGRILRAALGGIKPPQPKRRVKASASALVAPSTLETKPDLHAGEFWCTVGEHWVPRKSNRGRAPTVCDEHKGTDSYIREQRQATLDSAEARGAAVADRLEELLREKGTHLSQNTDRFQLQRWDSDRRRWDVQKVTADNWGVRYWMMDDANAHAIKIKRMRWVKTDVH